MRVPYNKVELLSAMSMLSDSLFEDMDSLQDSLKEILGVAQPLLNLQAADFHGITVVDLINSPNYENLLKSYQESLVFRAVTYLEGQKFTNQEAWAVICILFGILDI